jgi:hypothetical protein
LSATHCRFSMEIQSDLVDRVVGLDAMSSMLDTLFEEL